MNATVKDVVRVAGSAADVITDGIILDQARHVQGVVAVRDRLSYPRNERPVPGPGPLF